MVEELKLAIKIDDDAIEQSLLKQFNNAEKMADKVVLTFKNINLDDKNIEAKFKEMQKMAGKNPIDFSISDKSVEMLSAISKQLSNIFEIAKGKSLIDSSSTVSEVSKISESIERGITNSVESAKNKFESLKSEITEVEKAYSKIKENVHTKKESKYVDNHSGNYVDLSEYSSTKSTKSNFEYLENKLKEIYSLYNNISSAVANNNGWFNGEQYDSSDLEKIIVDFKSLAQAYYELDVISANKSYKDLSDEFGLPLEKIKTLKQVTSKMSSEFKNFVNEVISDSDDVKSHNKIFFEEEKRLLVENEQAVKTYIELRQQLLSKITNENEKDRISDYIPYISEDFPDFSGMPKFGSDLFGDNIDVLKEMCNVLGIKIPEAVSKTEQKLANVEQQFTDSSFTENQDKIQQELKETEQVTEQTAEALEKINSNGNKSNNSSENGILDNQKQLKETKKLTDDNISSLYEFIKLCQEQAKVLGETNEKLKERAAYFKDENISGKVSVGTHYSGNHDNSVLEGANSDIHSHFSKYASFSETDLFNLREELKNFMVMGTDELTHLDLSGLNNEILRTIYMRYDTAVKELNQQFLNNLSIKDNLKFTEIEDIPEQIFEKAFEYAEKSSNIDYDYNNYDEFFEKETRKIQEKLLKGASLTDIVNIASKDISIFEVEGLPDDIKVFKEKFIEGIRGYLSNILQENEVFDPDKLINNKEFNKGRNDALRSVLEDLGVGADRLKTIDISNLEKGYNSVLNVLGLVNNEQEKVLETAQKIETKQQTPIEDVFQTEKVEQTTTSAKELDKTLEQVNIPTDSFDDVLSKLDLAKSELKDIVKITKQSVSDAEGKFHDSYTLKDSRGSTEIYGLSSNTEKGQLLRSNIVQYEVKDEEQEKKALLEVEKQITEETKKQNAEQQKKWDNFQKENAEENKKAYQELTDTIQQYSEVSKRIANGKALDGDIELAKKLEDKISTLQKQDILSPTQIDESERKLEKLFNQLDVIEKKQSNKVAEQEAKEIEKVWEDNLKAITDYMDAKTKLNNLEASDKKSNKKSNEIADLTQEVEKAKVKAEEARIALSSMVNPHDVNINTWDKWLKMMEDFRQAGDGSSQSIAKLKDAIANVNTSELQTIDKYIESAQKKLDSTKSSRDDSEKSSSFKTYEKKVQECIAALIAERNRLENAVKSGDIEIIDEGSLSNLNNLKQKLEEVNSDFKTTFKGSAEISRWKEIDAITKYMEKNTRISKEAKDKLREYIETLKTNGADANVEEIHQAFLRVCDGERKAKREGQSFLDVLRDKVWYQWAAQIGSYFSLNDILRYAKEGIQTVRELDTALAEMRKVSDESASSLKRVQDASFDLANEVGTTALQIQNSIADFMRIGDSVEEAQKHALDANTLLQVSEFDNIEDATSALVSMSKAWDDIDTKHINDVLNILGNNMPIATDELASSLQRSAGTLATLGATIEEAAALTVAGNTNCLKIWKHILKNIFNCKVNLKLYATI